MPKRIEDAYTWSFPAACTTMNHAAITIYGEDQDRTARLEVPGDVCSRVNWPLASDLSLRRSANATVQRRLRL